MIRCLKNAFKMETWPVRWPASEEKLTNCSNMGENVLKCPLM